MATKQNIKPLFGYVLIKPVKQEEVTASGIILPDTVQKKTQFGEVMAVGPGEMNQDGKVLPMMLKEKQIVVYKQWGGNEVKVGNEEWLLIEQKDVMAIVG